MVRHNKGARNRCGPDLVATMAPQIGTRGIMALLTANFGRGRRFLSEMEVW